MRGVHCGIERTNLTSITYTHTHTHTHTNPYVLVDTISMPGRCWAMPETATSTSRMTSTSPFRSRGGERYEIGLSNEE